MIHVEQIFQSTKSSWNFLMNFKISLSHYTFVFNGMWSLDRYCAIVATNHKIHILFSELCRWSVKR